MGKALLWKMTLFS